MIVVVPPATPATAPEVPTVPTAGLLLLHVPPPSGSLNVTDASWQTLSVPIMADTTGLTVTVAGTELAVVVVGIQPTVAI